jgi:hypothetical protein
LTRPGEALITIRSHRKATRMTVHSITQPDTGNPPPTPPLPARPGPLSESQLAVLGLALDDATSHRAVAFSSRCEACDRLSPGLCSEHAADLDRISDYLDLAAQLGVAI